MSHKQIMMIGLAGAVVVRLIPQLRVLHPVLSKVISTLSVIEAVEKSVEVYKLRSV